MARYIDADNLIKKIQEQYNNFSNDYGYYDHFTQGYEDALSTVENEPAADVAEVRRGKWERAVKNVSRCTECGCARDIRTQVGWNFCPVCGAKMSEEENA